MMKFNKLVLGCVVFFAIGEAVAANVIAVTPGSTAAYVFCPKANCPSLSTVGRWMFKLQPDTNVSAALKNDSFVTTGLGSVALKWTDVQNRVYVGYGEFTMSASDPTKGTFSGIVDIPPVATQSGCPAYSDYCLMSGPTGGTDTPFRTCYTTKKWSSTGLATETCNNWNPNTGVVECKIPMSTSFTTTYGTGAGNCVAHYVQRRIGTSSMGTCTPNPGFDTYQYLYQVRVYNLQIQSATDFSDATCTAKTK